MTKRPSRTPKKIAQQNRRKADGTTDTGKTSTPLRDKPAGSYVWIVAFLIVINLIVYAPLRNYGFVNYDDPGYVFQNPHVTGGFTWNAIAWAFTTGNQANWHPLTWLSHLIDIQLFGLNPGAHHLVNLVFHIANTLLLFWIFLQMTGTLGRSVFIAALFAVHPLHVESVAWLAERKDVLSTFLGLLTLSLYVGYVRQPRVTRYAAMIVCFAAGLMAKPMFVTLPFVLLLLDFWPLGRMTFRPQGNLLKLVREKIPLLTVAAISSVVTFVVQQAGGAMAGVEVIPVSSRIANACVAYVTYAWKMVWPANLGVMYPNGPVSSWWLAAALGLAALSLVSIRAAQRWPYLAVGWFWYLGTLVPVIGLVQVGRQSMADRYSYVPLVGLFLIVAFGMTELLKSQAGQFLWIAGGLVIVACMWQARTQLQYWSSSITLWEHTLSVTRNNSLAHFNLGAALDDAGRIDDAMAHYSEALRIEPDYADAHSNIANDLLKGSKPNKFEEASRHLAEALRINPRSAEAHNELGLNYALQGKTNDARIEFLEAIRLKPEFALAHSNLGGTFANQGRFAEAIAEYALAINLDPRNVEAHLNLGIVLATQGKTSEAVPHFAEVLRINPNHNVARSWLDKLEGKNGASR